MSAHSGAVIRPATVDPLPPVVNPGHGTYTTFREPFIRLGRTMKKTGRQRWDNFKGNMNWIGSEIRSGAGYGNRFVRRRLEETGRDVGRGVRDIDRTIQGQPGTEKWFEDYRKKQRIAQGAPPVGPTPTPSPVPSMFNYVGEYYGGDSNDDEWIDNENFYKVT